MTQLSRRVAITAILTVLTLAACSPGNGSRQTDTLTMSLAMPVDSLDPTVAYQTSSFGVLANIFQTLVKLDPAGNIVPGLATSYHIDSDKHTIEFDLDPDARFSNGNPVTSADVAFSAKLWKQSQTWGSWYKSIVDVSTPGPNTAVFHLSSTGVALLGVLAVGAASVVPDNFNGVPRDEFFRKPIGSGPYVVQSAKLSEQIETSVNPHYRSGGTPHFKKVVFKIIPDASQRLVQFQEQLSIPVDRGVSGNLRSGVLIAI